MIKRHPLSRLLLFPALLLAVLISVLALLASPSTTGAEEGRLFDKEISAVVEYKSFQEAIRQVESNTGCTVSISTDVAEFLKHLQPNTYWRVDGSARISIKRYLDVVFGSLGLQWALDDDGKKIGTSLRWAVSDPRTPAELLQCIKKPKYSSTYCEGEKPLDQEWETAFNALLSKECNFGKSWKVRQRAFFDGHFMNWDRERLHLIMVDQIVSETDEKYVLVVLEQPILMIPGRGSMSCYWFEENGVLKGADIVSTGHRCKLVDAGIVGNPKNELQIVVKMNASAFLTQCYHLRDDSLRLISAVWGSGRPAEQDGMRYGISIVDYKMGEW